MFPVFDAYSALVYSANASNVKQVFVDGKCVVKDKRLVDVNLDEIRKVLDKVMTSFKEEAIKRNEIENGK